MKENQIFSAFYHATLWGSKTENWNSKDNKFSLVIPLMVSANFGNHLGIDAHKLIRGKNKGKIILRLKSFDYTKELEFRKVDWKLTGRNWENPFIRNKNGKTAHISKVYPLTDNRAWIDFGQHTKDAAYLIFDKDRTYENITSIKIYVAPDTKHDSTFRQLFAKGDFDEDLRQLEANTMQSSR